MAVLVEGISVIARRDRIKTNYRQGWAGFLEDVPNNTLCYDEEITSVIFFGPEDVEDYVNTLVAGGLKHIEAGKCVDIAVADQQQGFAGPCDWLEFARIPFGETDGRVSMCWFYDEPRIAHGHHFTGKKMQLVTPDWWQFEGSLSDKFKFIPTENSTRR